MNTIGQRILAARRARSWTRRVLALKTGYTEQSIVNWETDQGKPSERAIRALEKAFKAKLRS